MDNVRSDEPSSEAISFQLPNVWLLIEASCSSRKRSPLKVQRKIVTARFVTERLVPEKLGAAVHAAVSEIVLIRMLIDQFRTLPQLMFGHARNVAPHWPACGILAIHPTPMPTIKATNTCDVKRSTHVGQH
jgi:hypothetical protein